MFHFDDTEEWIYDTGIDAIVFFVNIYNLLYKCVITKSFIEEYYGKCTTDEEYLEIARANAEAITGLISRKLDSGEHRKSAAVYLN